MVLPFLYKTKRIVRKPGGGDLIGDQELQLQRKLFGFQLYWQAAHERRASKTTLRLRASKSIPPFSWAACRVMIMKYQGLAGELY